MTPEFGFVVGFLLSVGYAFRWVEKWSINLCLDTFSVLAGGISLFVFSSILFRKVFLKYKIKLKTVNSQLSASENAEILSVPRWKLILFLLLQVLTLMVCIYFLLVKVGGGLISAIYAIDRSSKVNEDGGVSFPFVIKQLRYLSFASSFVWSYIFAIGRFYKVKTHYVLLFMNILLSIVIYLLGGARQGIIQLLVGIGVIFYFVWGYKNKWKKRIAIKRIAQVIVIVFVFALLFPSFGSLLGRNLKVDPSSYIAVYVSSGIKNLDTFIREGRFGIGASFSSTQTFSQLAIKLAGHFGLPERTVFFDQQYRYVNGNWLGNIYTTFWAFLYDGGVTALVFYTLLMSFILQWVYAALVKDIHLVSRLSVPMLLYSYMYFEPLFSFFHSWFYARTFNTTFIIYIFYWLLLKLFIEKVHFNHKR